MDTTVLPLERGLIYVPIPQTPKPTVDDSVGFALPVLINFFIHVSLKQNI